MKLSDLIQELQGLQESFDEKELDPEVMSTSDYGDHCHTEQLVYIKEVNVCIPKDSAYSQSGKRYPNEEEDEQLCELTPDQLTDEYVIVLRYIQ